MLVYDDAAIAISPEFCPSTVKLREGGTCIIQGRLSRQFATGDVEITLSDKSMLIFDKSHLLSFVHESNSARWVPFGKTGTIILVIAFFSLFAWLTFRINWKH